MAEARRGFAPPPEVPRYFADKGLRPGFSWLDVWGEEHAHAFTVAKATELELLAAFKSSIQSAIEKGQGFETWRDGLRPELQKLGWWGKRTVADPTGRDRPASVNFSKPRRLETIFWSNMRSARAAGQWERAQRTKDGLPYFLYVRTTSAEPRREHLAYAGTILPVDDGFWNSHFPPNGWNCKCSVRQITRRERDGLVGQDGYNEDAPEEELRTFVNRRTGEVSRVPAGIDPGWATNPGRARARTLLKRMEERLDEAPLESAKRAVQDLWSSDVPDTMTRLPERVYLPAAIAPARLVEIAGVEVTKTSAIVSVSSDTVAAKVRKHAVVSPDTFGLVQRIVDEGALVDRGTRGIWAVARMRGQIYRVAIGRSGAGNLFVRTFHPIRKQAAAEIEIPILEEDDR